MLLIGLTGPSGAGKSTVAQLFASHGLPVLNADEIYHALLIPPSACLDAIVARFGACVLTSDGTLNRQALGDAVFSDPNALEDLNTISHRFVMEEVERRLAQMRAKAIPAAVLDAPQLFEAGAHRICDTVISVLATQENRAQRIMQRDHIDHEHAMRRIRAQKSDEFFRANSDYVIENNTSPDQLAPTVCKLLQKLGVITA